MDTREKVWHLLICPSKVVIFDSTVRLRRVQLVSGDENVQLKFGFVTVDQENQVAEDKGTICTLRSKDDSHQLNLLFLRGDVVKFHFPSGLIELTGDKEPSISVGQSLTRGGTFSPRMWFLDLHGEQRLRLKDEVRLRNATICGEFGDRSGKSTVSLKTTEDQIEICSLEPAEFPNRSLNYPLPVDLEFVLTVDSNVKIALIGERSPSVLSCGELGPCEILLNSARQTFVPIVEKRDGGVTASKFGGVPFCSEESPWPICPGCSMKLTLFLQLNSSDVPAEAAKVIGSGIFQLFYCANEDTCETDLEEWSPFSIAHCLRVVRADEVAIPVDTDAECFVASTIVGWNTETEFPHFNDVPDLPEANHTLLQEADQPLQGEKLFGWPNWVQGLEYPDCPECSQRMEFFFQLDSNQNLPYMFGDAGIGHVFYCPSHKGQFAFGWACC